jgi:hypothetical protein
MPTLYRWKDNKGNASEPMLLESANMRDKQEKLRRNPHGFYWTTDYQTCIYPIEVTESEYRTYTS